MTPLAFLFGGSYTEYIREGNPSHYLLNTMTRPVVSHPETSIYRSYWRQTPSSEGTAYKVLVGRDTELEAGFEPRVEKTFATLEEAEAYVAQWQPLYDDRVFLIA